LKLKTTLSTPCEDEIEHLEVLAYEPFLTIANAPPDLSSLDRLSDRHKPGTVWLSNPAQQHPLSSQTWNQSPLQLTRENHDSVLVVSENYLL
jgi:hypothetical protein